MMHQSPLSREDAQLLAAYLRGGRLPAVDLARAQRLADPDQVLRALRASTSAPCAQVAADPAVFLDPTAADRRELPAVVAHLESCRACQTLLTQLDPPWRRIVAAARDIKLQLCGVLRFAMDTQRRWFRELRDLRPGVVFAHPAVAGTNLLDAGPNESAVADWELALPGNGSVRFLPSKPGGPNPSGIEVEIKRGPATGDHGTTAGPQPWNMAVYRRESSLPYFQGQVPPGQQARVTLTPGAWRVRIEGEGVALAVAGPEPGAAPARAVEFEVMVTDTPGDQNPDANVSRLLGAGELRPIGWANGRDVFLVREAGCA